jgi:hypothetical protein
MIQGQAKGLWSKLYDRRKNSPNENFLSHLTNLTHAEQSEIEKYADQGRGYYMNDISLLSQETLDNTSGITKYNKDIQFKRPISC